jgi:hypothetical protein
MSSIIPYSVGPESPNCHRPTGYAMSGISRTFWSQNVGFSWGQGLTTNRTEYVWNLGGKHKLDNVDPQYIVCIVDGLDQECTIYRCYGVYGCIDEEVAIPLYMAGRFPCMVR